MKIGKKVFQMISLALLFLLSSQMIFQTLFLEKVYISNKKSSITKEMKNLAQRLEGLSEQKINRELRLYTQRFEATTGIVNVSGVPLYEFDTQSALMEIETVDGKEYTVYLSQFLGENDLKECLRPGAEVALTGVLTKSYETIYPSTVEVDGKVFKSDIGMNVSMITSTHTIDVVEKNIESNPYVEVPADQNIRSSTITLNKEVQALEEERIIGKIKEVYIPGDETFGTGYRENKILQEMAMFLYQAAVSESSLTLGKPIVYESVDTYVGIRNIMSIVPLTLNHEIQFLVSMTSLEQVEEAIGIINRYTFIIFIVAFVFALLIAYWYARKFTKPLIEIKDVTNAITQLDFTRVCKIDSQDEIGELALNINHMSKTLKDTLDKLQEDMAFKERLNEQRKQFIIDVSHELKTPLTVLKATCEGYKDKIYECNDQGPIQNMLTQIDTMSDMVQELLTVVRLEQEQSIQIEAFDLEASFLKVYSEYKSLAKEKEITTQFDLEESIVMGERKKIETVLKNFYSNAVFYTPIGGTIFVTIKRIEDRWCCSIENKGATLQAEEIEKIWEPFYRVDQSRNKKLGGTGLGLYIVSKILESHGARYGIESLDQSVRAWFILEAVDIEM